MRFLAESVPLVGALTAVVVVRVLVAVIVRPLRARQRDGAAIKKSLLPLFLVQ